MVTLRRMGILAFVVASFCASSVNAQDNPISKLAIHGFLNQAYARSATYALLGIPTRGTIDYRNAAVQFRFAISDRDNFVFQMEHVRFGESPNAAQTDIGVERVFYQRSFGSSSALRLGKVLLPMGIYSEIRDVGTLLPFFAVPSTIYPSRTYDSETLDGVVLDHRISVANWRVDLSGYYGSWDYLQYDLATEAKAKNVLGGQAWLQTPLTGLRLGLGGRRYDASNALGSRPVDRATGKQIVGAPIPIEANAQKNIEWYVSADATLERVMFRAEQARRAFDRGSWRSEYAQAGLNLTSKLSLWAQAERRLLAITITAPVPRRLEAQTDRDFAASVRYALSPNLLFRVEAHAYQGTSVDNPLLGAFSDAPVSSHYMILSVATSF